MGHLFYPVHGLDYRAIVQELSQHHTEEARRAIIDAITKSDLQAQWKNELKYFYVAIYNAAMRQGQFDVVVWLSGKRGFEKYIPKKCLNTAPLPLIGGRDDKLLNNEEQFRVSNDEEAEKPIWIN